jgi:hypothetical protein
MSCNGEWYNEQDGRSMRKGYTTPMHQVREWDCSCHAAMEVMYELTGADISEESIVNWAVSQGLVSENGAGHDIFQPVFDHFSPQHITTKWINYPGMQALNDIMNDHCRTFFCHTLLSNAYGHYQVILKVGVNQDDVLEQYSVGNAQLRYLSGSTFREWLNGISQSSICVCSI